MKIQGRVAAVVGAAQGVGLAYVQALLDKGAYVTIGDVLVEDGKAREAEFKVKYGEDRVHFVKCDVIKQEDVDEFFKETLAKFSQLDIVINNAGIINEINWEQCLQVNVFGVIRTTEAAMRIMGKDKGGAGGVVVTTASVSGLYPDYWGPVYCASKHATVAFTRAWAMDINYKKHGVRMNMICPATIATDFKKQVSRAINIEEKIKDMENEIHMDVSVVADLLITLIEDDSKNGTAQQISPKGVMQMEFPEYTG